MNESKKSGDLLEGQELIFRQRIWEAALKIVSKQEKLQSLLLGLNEIVYLSIEEVTFPNDMVHVDNELKALANSIIEDGLLQNIVAELNVDADLSFQVVCIDGYRRLAALKMINYRDKIPCMLKIQGWGERTQARWWLNQVRQKASLVQLAEGFCSLHSEGWTVDQISEQFCKHKKTIARYMRLGFLPADIREMVSANPKLFTTRLMFNKLLVCEQKPGETRKTMKRMLTVRSGRESDVSRILI